MRQRGRIPLTFLASLLVIACAFLVMVPMGAGAAASSGAVNQHSSLHSPHLFLKHKSKSAMLHKSSVLHPLASGNNLNYGGGPVMTGTTNAYAIFWEPGNNVSANYNSLIKRYLGDIGGSPLYQIANQYTQSGGGFPSNAVLAGSWVDTGAYPETPVLDSDLQNEVTHAQQVNGWQSSIDNIFFVFTGRGENICIDSTQSQCASNTFCAYHNFFWY